ncbi:hypothetical protein T484DRAFT_1843650 [Baffinella frigidus]|nr:hypothetical protein T484DRAFT_1843650 [Cryptophyta sp. CCMP2293]
MQQLLSTDEDPPGIPPLSGVGRGTLKSEAYGEEEGEELLEEDLTGVQSKQGAGFKIAFYPKNSTVFDPMKSKSFRVVPKQMFLLGYADNTHLKGFQSRDVVQLGDFFVDTKFGSITDCNSPDFNNVDGILGFGMPVQHQAAPPPPSGLGAMMGGGGGGGAPPVVLPLPLLFGLTDPTIKNSENNHVLSRRAFSFMSTDTAAEIQLGGPETRNAENKDPQLSRRAFSLMSTDTADAAEIQPGGYDPASVDGRMFLTPSITMNDYVVVSLSLK